MTLQVMYGAKGRSFSMDGKRRILIISFFDCTQVSSRKKHRKVGRIQEAFLKSESGGRWRSELGTHGNYDRDSSPFHHLKKLSFALPLMSIYPSYHITE